MIFLLINFLFIVKAQIYIHPDSKCTSCDGSISSPFPDIKNALLYGGTTLNEIILMDGVFYINDLTISKKDLTISSLNGASNAIISGSSINCMNLISGTFTFKGITIRNCIKTNNTSGNITQNNSGAGIFISSANVNLIDMVFENNKADFVGGGIAIISGSLFLYNCSFNNNSALKGGAIYSKSAYILISNLSHIQSNYASFSGAGIFIESGSIEFKNSSSISGNTIVSNYSKNQISCIQASITFQNEASYGNSGYICDRCSIIDKNNANNLNLCNMNDGYSLKAKVALIIFSLIFLNILT